MANDWKEYIERWFSHGLQGSEFRLLCAVKLLNDRGVTRPKRSQIVGLTGLCSETVDTAREGLINKKLLRYIREGTGSTPASLTIVRIASDA